MTSPLRGPASRAEGRRSRLQAAPAGERHGQSAMQPPQLPPSPASPRDEPVLRAALDAAGAHRSAVRYRGFVLLPQPDLGWLVRPERSPMTVLPFRTPPISLSDVKALVDWRLDGARLTPPLQARR